MCLNEKLTSHALATKFAVLSVRYLNTLSSSGSSKLNQSRRPAEEKLAGFPGC